MGPEAEDLVGWHLSDWPGQPAKPDVYRDWVYGGRFQEIFG